MNNIIIDTLPLTISVGGRDLPIETNFRTGMLFELMMMSGEVPEDEKIEYAVNLYFPREFPRSAAEQREAIDGMLWFYMCGDQDKREPAANGSGGDKPSIIKRIYDYEIDAPMIYAAFLSQYGIDLQDIEYLHWWKFVAMFMALHENEKIVEIMGYRSIDLAKIKNRKEREHYAALQGKYRLPDNRSTEEKAAAAGAVFGGFFK